MYSSTSDLSRRFRKAALGRLPGDLTSSSASLAPSLQKCKTNSICLSPTQQGNLRKIETPKPCAVNIFLCCNPDDSTLERKAIRTKVAKELRQKFEEIWDIEIKIVDSSESFGPYSLNHEDRIKEIVQCRETSTSVCFVALIGHKYWSTNIPASIPADVFGILLRSAYDRRFSNWKLLENYYEHDQNSVPAVYVLKTSNIPLLKDETKKVLFQLHSLLRQGAQHCFEQKLLTEVQVKIFLVSSFDDELQVGLFNQEAIDPKRCMCYVRTITDMEQDMNIARVNKYVDVALRKANSPSSSYVSTEMLDVVAQKRINSIRELEIPEVVTYTNGQLRVYTCSVRWLPQTGIQEETHKTYLEDFCLQFSDTVSKITAQNIETVRQNARKSEVLCHFLLAKQSLQYFHDVFPDLKSQLLDYICGQSKLPLVLHGKSGTGKTYLMSSIANDVHSCIPNALNAISIVRFVGKTVSSSCVPLLLDSICNQLEYCFPKEKIPPGLWCTDVKHLEKRLEKLLEKASRKCSVIVLIDGISDLRDWQNFPCLGDWLPCSLPENVKMIISLNSEQPFAEKILANIREEGFPEVQTKSLNQREYIGFIRTKLSDCGRQITSGQYVYAMQAANTEVKGEYTIGLAAAVLAHAKRWKSSYDVSAHEVGYGEGGVIKKLIPQVQKQFGNQIVQTAVCLLTSVTYGITERDLHYLLVSTESVKMEVWNKLQNSNLQSANDQDQDALHSNVTNCLILLLREFSQFLDIKYIGGCHVYCWRRTYIKNVMLTLFKETEISNMKKCLVMHYIRYMNKKSKVPLIESLKSVHICMELFACSETENPSQIVSEIVPLNFLWLHTILHAVGVVQLLCLLEQSYKNSKDRSILVVERAIRLALPMLHRSPNSFAGELFSRLSYFSSSFVRVDKLIQECVSKQRTIPSLLPAGVHAQAPGAPLRVSINEHQPLSKGVVVYEKHSLMCLTYCCSRTLKMFDMHNGDVIREILFKEDIEWLKLSKNLEYIIIFLPCRQNLFILDEATCSCNYKLSLLGCFHHGKKDVPPRSIDAFLSASLAALWSRHYSSTVVIISLSSGTINCTILCVEEVEDCIITNDETTLITLSLPQSIWLYNSKTGESITCLQPFTISGDSILHVFENYAHNLLTVHVSGFINVWKLHGNSCQHVLELDSRSTRQKMQSTVNAAISICGEKLAIIKPGEIDVWNLVDWKAECEIVSEEKEEFFSAAFSNQAEYICITVIGNPSLYIWQVETSSCVAVFHGHTNDISGICIPHFTSPQTKSTWVVSYENCMSIKVWNLENMTFIPTITITGRPIHSISCVEQCTVTTDGSDTATIWETVTGNVKFELKHASTITHCCTSTDKVITADNAGYQYVWKTETGENLIKIKGSKVGRLLVTPNQQMVVTMFVEPAESQPGVSCASRVWHLDTAQVICSFDYHLINADVTSKNTFLVGISMDGKLNAVSLWMGMLAKVITSPGGVITCLHALAKRDEVITIDSHNLVCLWNIGLGSNIITLDMKATIMRDICISDSGSVVTMMDPKQGFKALDVQSGKMRSVETKHIPIMSQISTDGLYLFYVSMKTMQAVDGCPQEAEYDLVAAKLTTGKIISSYPLESIPTCLNILKPGKQIAVGVEEGRSIVFNFITKDMPALPTRPKTKTFKRKAVYPKDKCDGIWHTYEPKYETAPPEDLFGYRHQYPNNQNKQFSQRKLNKPSTNSKVSIHVQRSAKEAGKSVNLSRISSSNKVRVFM